MVGVELHDAARVVWQQEVREKGVALPEQEQEVREKAVASWKQEEAVGLPLPITIHGY